MNKLIKSIKTNQQQKGAVLAISLIILLLLTILGITALKTTIFDEKMSGNMRDSIKSFQAAESALREAEAWVSQLSSHPIIATSCASYPCVITLDTTNYLEDKSHTWWLSNSAPFTSATLTNIQTQPRFIIEEDRYIPDSLNIGQGNPDGKQYYRITARGTGATDNAKTILQSTAPRRY